MKIWTVHAKPATSPVLLPERFSWGGFLFGPFWLLAHRAWIAGLIALAADIAIAAARIGPAGTILGFGISWLIGLFGQDLRRWSLERRGFALAEVVTARDGDGAWLRLLDRRPDLAREAAR